MFSIRIIGLGLSLALGVGVANAQHAHPEHKTPPAPQPAGAAGDPYMLSTDPVTGEPLGDKPILYQHDGRELRFTDQRSLDTFKQDPAKHVPAVDQQMIKQQMSHYPLDVCLVTGGKLGGMGEPVNHLYRNRLVRFCCAGCMGGFEKDPAKHLAKLDAAVIDKQKKEYPTDTCLVSGDKLGGEMGEPLDYVVGNRLIRLCCSGCVRSLIQTPATYLDKLDGMASRKAGGEAGPENHDRKDAANPGSARPAHQH